MHPMPCLVDALLAWRHCVMQQKSDLNPDRTVKGYDLYFESYIKAVSLDELKLFAFSL